jgi:hypothetical protein
MYEEELNESLRIPRKCKQFFGMQVYRMKIFSFVRDYTRRKSFPCTLVLARYSCKSKTLQFYGCLRKEYFSINVHNFVASVNLGNFASIMSVILSLYFKLFPITMPAPAISYIRSRKNFSCLKKPHKI